MNSTPRPFQFSGRIRSFRYAGRGIRLTVRTQHNAWIHAVATVLVVLAGIALGVSQQEWCVLILACIAVWVAEGLNTAFELLADATTKEFHPVIGQAKDVAAGAVLIAALGAVAIGLLVFAPKLLEIIRG
jgi:diacylglycerol kinase (ATP)